MPRLAAEYEVAWGSLLGEGGFGQVRIATHRKSGQQYALKFVAKRNVGDCASLTSELEVLVKLDHPYVVRLLEYFESDTDFVFVFELCTGGELFDRIVEKGYFSEAAAAMVFRQVCMGVNYCHAHSIMHRDLKPENFMYSTAAEDAPIKLIDFGLSVRFGAGQVLHAITGSRWYTAPEVLSGEYDQRSDVWSLGVLLFILLLGYPPFPQGEGFEQRALAGRVDADARDWARVSAPAKALVASMLSVEVATRASLRDVLEHPWLTTRVPAPASPLSSTVFTKLATFSAMSKFTRSAFNMIARVAPAEEVAEARQLFVYLDEDKDGLLSYQDLKSALQVDGAVPPSNFDALCEKVDVSKSGAIDYTEFLALMLSEKLATHRSVCEQAFDSLATEGGIDAESLAAALGGAMSIRRCQMMLLEAGPTRADGRGTVVTFDQFFDMVRSPSLASPASRIARTRTRLSSVVKATRQRCGSGSE